MAHHLASTAFHLASALAVKTSVAVTNSLIQDLLYKSCTLLKKIIFDFLWHDYWLQSIYNQNKQWLTIYTSMSSVGSPSHLRSSINLNVLDHQRVHIQSLNINRWHMSRREHCFASNVRYTNRLKDAWKDNLQTKWIACPKVKVNEGKSAWVCQAQKSISVRVEPHYEAIKFDRINGWPY